MMFVHAAVAWCVILGLAVANGVWREAVLAPRLGLRAATAVSGLLLIAAVTAVSWLLVLWSRPDRAQAWQVGVGWLLATLVFELSFGLWQGKSQAELLGAYTFADGNLWPLVLLAVLVGPRLCRRAIG